MIIAFCVPNAKIKLLPHYSSDTCVNPYRLRQPLQTFVTTNKADGLVVNNVYDTAKSLYRVIIDHYTKMNY